MEKQEKPGGKKDILIIEPQPRQPQGKEQQGKVGEAKTVKPPQADTAAIIAELLIKEGILTNKQLEYAQRVFSKLPAGKTMLGVIVDLKYVSNEQVEVALKGKEIKAPIGELLVELGHLKRSDLEKALAIQREDRTKKIGEIFLEQHFVQEEKLLGVLSHRFGVPYLDVANEEFDDQVLGLASFKEYRLYNFIPIRREGEAVLVAFGDDINEGSVRVAKKVIGKEVKPAIGRAVAIGLALSRHEARLHGDLVIAQSESVVVEAVNSIIIAAIKEKASDIHIEPMKNSLRVRLRIDGVLIPHKEYSLELMPPIISRLKIMAGADIAEKRRHQDGRILFENAEYSLDLRVNFYATVNGEKVVMRLLNKQALLLNIDQVGMFPRMLQMFKEDALDASSGVILVTGPTGSGKTTTLYSGINYLDNIDVSIVTAEDPVEYVIDGIAQCSLNAKVQVTFEESLKHMMRQDPDIIVVGEIRDKVSAEAAIQAALTGHKVLTTFHTEDTVGGLIRLLDMNIEAFLIASTVVAVLAQRLVRRVCPDCAEDQIPTSHEIRRLGYKAEDFKGVVFKKGRGCKQCRFSGYRGRVPIFELLVLNELVKDALIARKTSYEIRRISIETAGLVTLLEDGIIKAAAGQTTFDEIMRQLPRLSPPRSFAELRRIQGELV